MTKIAIQIGGNQTVFINHPSDFGGMKAQLIGDGISADIIKIDPQSLKVWAKAQVTASAEDYRAQLASTSAGKLAEYRIKEEISGNRENADEKELALLSREAKARGTNRTGLLNDIADKAAAYRQTALLIGVLEAETNAAIAAIPDDAADIGAQVVPVLEGAKVEAEAEYQKAQELLAGD